MKTEIVSSGLDKISKIRKFCAKFSTVIAQNAIFDRAPAGRTTLNLYHGITHKEIIAIQVTRALIATLLLSGSALVSSAQAMPPWSKGANNPAVQTGYSFHVSDVDNVPDLHGNPADVRLVISEERESPGRLLPIRV
jgi:hypothetical protein